MVDFSQVYPLLCEITRAVSRFLIPILVCKVSQFLSKLSKNQLTGLLREGGLSGIMRLYVKIPAKSQGSEADLLGAGDRDYPSFRVMGSAHVG